MKIKVITTVLDNIVQLQQTISIQIRANLYNAIEIKKDEQAWLSTPSKCMRVFIFSLEKIIGV